MPSPDDHHTSLRTLTHYQLHAEEFWQGTCQHDVSQNIACLLRHLPVDARSILDFGCGPGRDLKTLQQAGYEAIGLDGAARFVEMARQYSGCEVWQQDFLSLALPPERFDGIFANASLFHIPSAFLPGVLAQLFATLKAGGVLFCSNPRGNDEEGWQQDRYGCWHSWPQWQATLLAAGFTELEHYYRPPGLPREQQPWLASVWRRP